MSVVSFPDAVQHNRVEFSFLVVVRLNVFCLVCCFVPLSSLKAPCKSVPFCTRAAVTSQLAHVLG